jgi:Zn-dependent protease
MLKTGIPLGRFFNIPVRLHWSWFFVFVLVTWVLANNYFKDIYNWNTATNWAVGAVTSILFFASVLVHELAHSRVAQAAGMQVHSITLFIFGGVSQLAQEPERPGVEFRMALAGPVTSLALGGIFWGIFFVTRDISEPLAGLSFWLGWINIALAAFNMIPGFPLDGGRVLRSILWWRSNNLRNATHTASTIGRGVGYLFILGGIFMIITPYWINGLWLAFIGWILANAAAGSYRQVAIKDMLQGHTVSEVMTRDCPVIPPKLTVEQLVNDYILGSGLRCFPVVEDGLALGLVTMHNVKAVPPEVRPTKTVRETMIPLDKLKWVRPNEDLSNTMQLLTEEDVNQVPVMENNTIVGLVTRDNLLSFIRTRGELGI